MQTEVGRHANRLGMAGWFWGGNYKIERYLYITHRISGLGLLLFFGFHLIETTFFRIQGESVWQSTVNFLQRPAFKAGLVLVIIAFVFHALNGLRLILMELGFGMGRPQRPVYPYRDALRKNRGYLILALGAIIVLVVVFMLNFFMAGAL